MALRLAMLNSSKGSKGYGSFSISRLTHSIAMPSPTDVLLSPTTKSPQCVLPESDQISSSESNGAGLGFPCSPFSGGSMELMAVPRKKVSRHKRGIRNGPKALKPIPVIIRCKACGRVKLPHFFCCSGERGNPGAQNGTTN
ncbi:hypothetical protein DCAR_0832111 [Daucus carota subsp. sativus]|uniref:Large ribosomal subunit protein bL32m n=1 Tax=Daucus carota subsp. sativus TaxID=79200 RepID=A0AAF1BAU5_DAUCS|nr:PREDICTED: uncharacterized protein LOC108197666 [Daucus carota subsp. sativus]WOH12605.1 hypothetical protein DCAR_0832111 [Daucus carota subsp. sativus]